LTLRKGTPPPFSLSPVALLCECGRRRVRACDCARSAQNKFRGLTPPILIQNIPQSAQKRYREGSRKGDLIIDILGCLLGHLYVDLNGGFILKFLTTQKNDLPDDKIIKPIHRWFGEAPEAHPKKADNEK
jgi:hypothetical protein